MEIKTDKFTQGPGTWKFNNLLLQDNHFVEQMKDKIRQCIADSNSLEIFLMGIH